MNEMVAIPSVVSAKIGFFSLRKRVLILGTGTLAQDLCRELLSRRKWSCEVVGFLDNDGGRVGEKLVNHGIIGSFGQFFEMVERYRVCSIAVCIEDRRENMPLQTLLDMKSVGLEIIDGHRMFEEESGRLAIDLLKPSSLIFSDGFRRRAVSMGVKRCMDLIISFFGLLFLAPLFLIIGLLIKMDSQGPVFYRQLRVGLRGQPYSILKFRSMQHNAEKIAGPQWACNGDRRITRVGEWLRKLRIDELPQLLNVLKGEMSMAGPRPERPVFVEELRTIVPYYDLRHTVRPGITGWAQIRFRYGASAKDSHVKLQYDLYYVKNFSIGLDLRIFLETARVTMLGEGAR